MATDVVHDQGLHRLLILSKYMSMMVINMLLSVKSTSLNIRVGAY